eukprot:1250262-Amphidinium_carterae.2
MTHGRLAHYTSAPYKQLAVADQELRFTLTCMYSVEHDRLSRSTTSINSVARALELIVCDWVGVVTLSFFDDYSMTVLEEIDGILEKAAWNAREGAKLAGRLNFCRAFVSGRHLNITLWDVLQRAVGEVRKLPVTQRRCGR